VIFLKNLLSVGSRSFVSLGNIFKAYNFAILSRSEMESVSRIHRRSAHLHAIVIVGLQTLHSQPRAFYRSRKRSYLVGEILLSGLPTPQK
jgi:hypothetical protein